MTEQNEKRLSEYDTYEVETKSIYFDHEFNCRDSFAAHNVKELADSIQTDGLQSPITVQPASEVPRIPDGYKYRIVAGHRRFVAVTVFLHWETIPAIVREGLGDDARTFNLKENLDREDLNPLEEAKAIEAIYGDESDAAIAQALKRSSRWVANRRRVLELPESLHKKVAIGLLTFDEVKVITRYPDEASQMRVARKILRAKVHGRNKTHKHVEKQRQKTVRTRGEISRMMRRLTRLRLDGFTTRLLGWSAGYITDRDINKDIKAVFRQREKQREE